MYYLHTWMIIKRQIPGPRSEGSPYIPVMTYTTAWPMVIIIPNTMKQRHLINTTDKVQTWGTEKVAAWAYYNMAFRIYQRSFPLLTSIAFCSVSSLLLTPYLKSYPVCIFQSDDGTVLTKYNLYSSFANFYWILTQQTLLDYLSEFSIETSSFLPQSLRDSQSMTLQFSKIFILRCSVFSIFAK